MRFKIYHLTEYTYSDNVFIEPHYLRFKPKITPYSTVENFTLDVRPTPAGSAEQLDPENNHVRLCWFSNMHQKIILEANSIVEAREFNPYNFLIYPSGFLSLPFKYDVQTSQLLANTLETKGVSTKTDHYLKKLLTNVNHQTIDFLSLLTNDIHEKFKIINRETGTPMEPDETFDKMEGSCRDLSWMQIHMFRHMGIAARFVSGYLFIESDTPEYELHAWTEAYLPGAGWIGLDPTHGMLAGAYHIPVASSAFYANTMPVTGAIRGNASAVLRNELHITFER